MSAVNQVELPICQKTKIHIEDPLAIEKLSWALASRLLKSHLKERPMVLLCIGTDRSTGDCLGPLIGSKLLQSKQNFFSIYGSLEQPVHASNLQEKIEEIHKLHHNPFIIAIDACLGKLENVGYISIGDGSIQPGAGVNKVLPSVGQIHITGIVNVGGFMEHLVLQNTRLNLVMKLANIIVEGMIKAINDLNKVELLEV